MILLNDKKLEANIEWAVFFLSWDIMFAISLLTSDGLTKIGAIFFMIIFGIATTYSGGKCK